MNTHFFPITKFKDGIIRFREWLALNGKNVIQPVLLRQFERFLPVVLAGMIVGAVLSIAMFRDIILSGALVFACVLFGALPLPGRSGGGRPGVFFAGSLSLFVLLLIGVMVFNYILNPLGIYPTSYFEPLVLNHDTTYRYKTNLYDSMNPPPEVVVLGSSRAFTVSPAYITEITGLSAFNASVHGGGVGDFIQFTRHMVDEGHPPRVIIVGLATELMVHKSRPSQQANAPASPKKKAKSDPSLAERLLGTDAYRSLNEFRADLSHNIDLVRQLAAWYQTEESIRQLKLEFNGRPRAFYRIDTDGLVHFKRPQLEKMVQANIADPLWGELFSRYDEVDKGALTVVKNLLALCRKNHIQVIFYLPPYQPQMLAIYDQQNFPRLKAEQLELLASLQDKYDFTVYDMTTVESFGGDETMFIDGVHPSEDASRLILDILLKDVPQE
jgi:hypothetical protein